MDVVSSSLRKAIIEGKDVTLSALRIPGYEQTKNNRTQCPHAQRTDKRITENLSISEFIVAFGNYRRIMGEAYPQRQQELDMYGNIVIRIHSLYGELAMNDYHKLFSAKSAEARRLSNAKVDWSFTNQAIYCMVTDRPEQNRQGTRPQTKSRTNRFHNGREVCNNYNEEKGCGWLSCRFAHVCSLCKESTHGAHTCKKSKGTPKTSSNR